MQRRVAVTGAGAISPLGDNWQDIRASLLSCKNKIRYMPEWDRYSELETRLASPVDNFHMPKHFSVKKKRGMGRVAQMAVSATEKALHAANLNQNPAINSGDTGVAYGSATGSSAAAMEFFNLLENQSMKRINGTTYLRMMSHSAAVNISVVFGTQGRMYTTSSACTAGSQAIGYAYEAIKQGQQKIMIAGGSEELCPTQAAVFDTIYATCTQNQAPQNSPRPFDKDRDGLVLGEGACTIILEDWDFARNRGATILAEIVGYATNTDGSHLVRPNKNTMAEVMKQSLRNANLNPEDIGYISGHGTATSHGDVAEAQATYNALGEQIPFSTLKSYVGHGLGACASLEVWLAIEMMREGWFNPTLNLENIDAKCAMLDHITTSPRQVDANYIMSNNFAFGGINTSLVIKNV